MELDDELRKALAARVRDQRYREYGTKLGAYRAAELNSATWDRIEEGLPVREDRLAQAVRTLWPGSNGDWRKVGGVIKNESDSVFGSIWGDVREDPDYPVKVENWIAELQDRMEALEMRVKSLELAERSNVRSLQHVPIVDEIVEAAEGPTAAIDPGYDPDSETDQ